MERYIKISIPVLIALLIGILLIYFNLTWLNNYVFILSSVIQLLMFFYWLVDDATQKRIKDVVEKNFEETKSVSQDVKEIKYFQNTEAGILEKRQKVLSNLIKNGVIPSIEINKIIKAIRKKGLFIISTSGGNKLDLKRLQRRMGTSEPLLIIPKILRELGFKDVYKNGSLFIILKDELPVRLRNSDKLREIINGELIGLWKRLQKLIINYNFAGYEKWKEGYGFHCNLCIINVEEGDLSILYKRLKENAESNDSFSDEFKGLLVSYSNKRKIGEILKNNVKAQQILDKVTLGLLFENLPEQIKNKLLNEEVNIRNKLNIKRFIDISNITKSDIKSVLKAYLEDKKLQEVSEQLMKEIKDYTEVIRELNLF